VAKEFRIVGPPGTGKTQFIRRQVQAWVDRGEYRPHDVVLTSFTNASAKVLRGRVPVPEANAATLHSICNRAIGSPALAEEGDLKKQWNDSGIPDKWKLKGKTADLEDGFRLPDSEVGSSMAAYSLARARMLPAAHPLWESTRAFAEAWSDFKNETDSIDFSDMLEIAMMSFNDLPGGQPVLMVDEAQDLNPMQWALVRQWSASCEVFIVAGDPAQTLYTFTGAAPDEFMGELPAAQQRLLGRSYRLPALIHRQAESFLGRHSGAMMTGRHYEPREEPGILRGSGSHWRLPDEVASITARAAAEGRSVLVLATCGYMLNPLIAEWRSRGLRFHNPMSLKNGQWNPLGAGTGPNSTAGKIAMFARSQPGPWTEIVNAKTAFVTRGGKKHVKSEPELVRDWLTPEALEAFNKGDVRWLADNVTSSYSRPAKYAAEIIARHGLEALEAEPRIIPSTVHTAKGAEADLVVMFPDVSSAAWEEMQTSVAGHDAAIRVGYVGMTRAKEELVICRPSSRKYLEL
jgi:DNA helicase-2/ATP-dependent DNA helicase PcrA